MIRKSYRLVFEKLPKKTQAELEKNDRYVVSVSELRKTEDIEKLAKRIRGRLKRF